MLPLGWSAVTDIGPSLSRSPSAGPSASAISVNGDAFVTFIDFVNRGLWVRRRDPAGDGFDAAVLVDAEGDYDQKIGADGLGNAIAAYGDSTGNILVRRFTRYGGAAGWGDAEVLMPGTQAMKPSLTGLVVTTGGHAVAVGSNDIAQRSSDLATFLTVYEAGRGWTPAVSPFSGLTPLTALASVAQVGSALRVATAASVLDPARANYTTLYGNTYTYDLTSHTGALGGAVALAMPAGTLDDYAGSLLMAGDGTGWLLASQVDTGGTTPAAVLLAPFAGGAWSAAAPFSAAATEDSVLAVAPGGDALAAWFDCGGTQDGTCMLGARRYTGGAWQPDVVVSSGGLSLSGGPWAAVDDQGHAVVVWTDAAASDSPALLAATLDPALGWSAPHTLDDVPYVDLDTGFADVTVGFGPEGTALVSWTVTASVGTKTVRAVFHRFL